MCQILFWELGYKNQKGKVIPLLRVSLNFTSQNIDWCVFYRYKAFIFPNYFFGSQRLTLCRYLAIDNTLGAEVSSVHLLLWIREVLWKSSIISHFSSGTRIGGWNTFICASRSTNIITVQTYLKTSLYGGAFAGRTITVIIFLLQCGVICHCIGPLGFLFWGEKLRNIISGPGSTEHVSQTDGFPN